MNGRTRTVSFALLAAGMAGAALPCVAVAAAPAVERVPLATYPVDPAKTVSRVEVKRLTLPPGVTTGRHSHPGPVVSYVVQGRILVRVEGGPARVFTAGQTILEPGGTAIVQFDNVSKTEPATFIANYLLGAEDTEIIKVLP